MDDEQRISETLEQLAPDLNPSLLLREDEEFVWGMRLNEDERIEFCLLPDQRKLVCSMAFPTNIPAGTAAFEFYESLLMAAEEESSEGGINPGLDENGVVLNYDLPMEMLTAETLGGVVRQLRGAAITWKAELPAADETPPDPPSDDTSNAIRV